MDFAISGANGIPKIGQTVKGWIKREVEIEGL